MRRRPQRPADIRGTNYYLSTSYAVEMTALGILRKRVSAFDPDTDGFFDARHNLSELSAIAAAGFNNVRAWGSFWAWIADRRGYNATIREFLANCNRVGLSVTWVLWNTVHTAVDISSGALAMSARLESRARQFQPNLEVNQVIFRGAESFALAGQATGRLPAGEPWLASGLADPGPYVMRNHESLADLTRQFPEFVVMMAHYLEDTAQAMDEAGSPLFSYDLFNEPDFDHYLYSRQRMYADVIANTYQVLSATHQAIRPHYTVGFAGLTTWNMLFFNDLRQRRVGLSYVSSHAYRTQYRMQGFIDTIRSHANTAQAIGMDYVCSEFWARFLAYPLPAPVAGYLRVLQAQVPKVGGQMWCFLETNLFEREMGDPRHYVPPPSPGPTPPRPVPVRPSPLPPPVQPTIRFAGPEAFDGIIRPRRGQWEPLRNETVWPGQVVMERTGSQTDLDAIRTWSMS